MRQLKGATQLETAKAIFVARETYTGWENQRSLPDEENCTALDEFFGTGPLIKDLREHCQREHLASWFEFFLGHEATSVEIRTYEPAYVPGLLQTEGYIRITSTSGQVNEEDIARRLSRAAILHRDEDPPHLFAVIEESALLRSLGNREAMREQLRHLLAMSALSHVHIQVAPMDAQWHPGFNGALTVFTTPEIKRVGYVEAQFGGRVIQGQHESWRLSVRFDEIRGAALSEDASRELIRHIMETMHDDRVA
ncbi:helix-turn-helix domain-containing protein [Actinocorallia aurea]